MSKETVSMMREIYAQTVLTFQITYVFIVGRGVDEFRIVVRSPWAAKFKFRHNGYFKWKYFFLNKFWIIKTKKWNLINNCNFFKFKICIINDWHWSQVTYFGLCVHGPTTLSRPGPARFPDFTITLRHITLHKTPLDEWSAWPNECELCRQTIPLGEWTWTLKCEKHESRLHLLAVIWWLAFWESVAMGKIPTTKEAENRWVVWQMGRNKKEFIFENF